MSGNGASHSPRGVTQAVVLAAGRGERLYPLTTLRPKVLLPVGTRPILEYVVRALVASQVQDLVLVVGYQREKVQDYFGSGSQLGARIRYVVQEPQLGTGHALLAARDLVGPRFLALGGDDLITAASVRELMACPEEAVLVTEMARGRQFGLVTVRDGLASSLVEKPPESVSPWVNTGAYLLSPAVMDYLEGEPDLPAAINRMLQQGRRVVAVETREPWWDAVFPWDLLRLNHLVLDQAEGRMEGHREPGVVTRGPVVLPASSILRANTYVVGPAVIGEGCEVGPGATIFPCTSIGNNVVIESFTQIRNCIIGNSVQVGSHSHLSDTIIAEGCTLGPRFTATSCKTVVRVDGEPVEVQMGSVVADDVEVGEDVSLKAGTLVGHGARIRGMNRVREDVPELGHVV